MLKRLLLLTLCGVLMLGAVACGEEAQEETTQTQEETETPVIGYTQNETVDRFLKNLQERSSLNTLNVTRGSNPNEYVLTLYGCQVSITPSTAGMGLVVWGEEGEKGEELVLGAFTHLVHAADKSCTQEQLDAAIAFMKEQTSSSGGFRVCNEVKLLSYSPSVEAVGVVTKPRLDLLLLNYRLVEETE